MRCASCTPSRTSISRTSKSTCAPTAPSTVCAAPVLRCTSNPRSVRRSITFWICSGLACCCIATIILVFRLLVGLYVEFCAAASLGCVLGGHDLLFLYGAHHVDDALEDMLQV